MLIPRSEFPRAFEKIERHLRSALLLAAAACLASPVIAMEPAMSGAQAVRPVVAETDRLIVKYRNATQSRQLDDGTLAHARAAGGRHGARVSHLKPTAGGAHVLKLDRALSEAEMRALGDALKASDANVEYAEPDRVVTIQLVPNDPSYGVQWDLKMSSVEPGALNTPAAWDLSTGAGITVAVLDTGYRPHADLVANLRTTGYDFVTDLFKANDGNARDNSALDPGDFVSAGACFAGSPAGNSSWHGTHVAGTIAAVTNNAAGVAGVAYGAKVLPVRVLGRCGGWNSDVAAAIDWASGGAVTGIPSNTTPARVINLSLGGSGACDTTYQNAINAARSRGTVIVVAAGNNNQNASGFNPANCAGVITVAAVGRTGGRAYYSNFGSLVDVAAPGGDTSTGVANGIYSTLNAGTTAPGADSYAYYQGTSMAAPHVAGVAALVLAKNPARTPDQVEALLKSTARAFPATCSQCGTGILNAAAAVAAAGGVTPPPPPPSPSTPVAETTAANNTIATAQVITPTLATVSGSISSSSDTDFFKVTLGAGKTLAATLRAASVSSDFDLYVYNASGAILARSTLGAGATDAVSYKNAGTTSRAVYVRVWRYGGTGAYTLGLSQ